MRPIVFLDLETTGLDHDDHIWEFGAVRRDGDMHTEYHYFIEHDVTKAEKLPGSFRKDHDTRYDDSNAITVHELVHGVMPWVFLGAPHVVGAVPNFDTERLARILRHYERSPLWHYHLHDVENLAKGWLCGRASMGDEAARAALANADDSDALSRACGIEPPTTGRHTALGDVRWGMALFDAITAST